MHLKSGPLASQVQRHSGFEWLCKHNRLRSEPIRFVRLDSGHAQSDGKSVNHRLPVLDLARGRGPVADQKDCGLGERDWEECEYINGLTTLLMTTTSKKQDNINIHCILIMHARIQVLTKSDKMWVIQCTSSNRGFKTDGCLVKAFQTQDSDCWPTQCFRQTAPLRESHTAIRKGPQKTEKGPI